MTMFFKRLMLSLCLLGVLALALPAGAQSAWTAWAYLSGSGRVLLIDSNGAVTEEFTLPLREGFDRYSTTAAVSSNGRYIAYVASQVEGETPGSELTVYDRQSATVIATHTLPSNLIATSFDFVASPANFDEAAQKVAVGYLYGDFQWEMVALSYGAPAEPLTLNAAKANEANVTTGLVLPVVQHFANGQVDFTMIYYATEGMPSYNSYLWDSVSGSVTPTTTYPSLSSETLTTTGEVLYPGIDASFPANPGLFADLGGFDQLNVLYVYDPVSGTQQPIFNDAQWSISESAFIENGARALVISYGTDNQSAWRILDRNGAVVYEGTAPSLNVWTATGTPDGFVYIDFDNTTLSILVKAIDTTSGSFSEPRTLWSGSDEVSIIRVEGGDAAAEFAPFAGITP